MEISSYQCLKSGDVTKVPYLLEVPEGGFTIISWEIVKFNAIKLNFSMTATVDQKFNFALKKEEELELWKCFYSTLVLFAIMAVRVYGCRKCMYDLMYR